MHTCTLSKPEKLRAERGYLALSNPQNLPSGSSMSPIVVGKHADGADKCRKWSHSGPAVLAGDGSRGRLTEQVFYELPNGLTLSEGALTRIIREKAPATHREWLTKILTLPAQKGGRPSRLLKYTDGRRAEWGGAGHAYYIRESYARAVLWLLDFVEDHAGLPAA